LIERSDQRDRAEVRPVFYPETGGQRQLPSRPPIALTIDPWLLWAGSLTTAMVAQLMAAAGMLFCYWLTAAPVLTVAPHGDVFATGYLMGSAVVATVVATLLLHLLLLVALEPMLFFRWTCALLTVLAAGGPWLCRAPLESRFLTSLLHLAIGLTVTLLLSRVAAGAVRARTPLIWGAGHPVPGTFLSAPTHLESR
jgi:hypothetical protein